jgi:hypothetical protein
MNLGVNMKAKVERLQCRSENAYEEHGGLKLYIAAELQQPSILLIWECVAIN